VLFSLWVTAASGYQAVYQALIGILIGLPIYAFLKARKEREGTAPEPIDLHPDLADLTVDELEPAS
jgi:APA family basic amino acid/polyamine antiporter